MNKTNDQNTEVIQFCWNGHKCEHYRDKNTLPKVYQAKRYNSVFCDICERGDILRNSNDGFYHCSICEYDKCFNCRIMSPIMYAIVMNDLHKVQILSKEDGFDINKKYTDCNNKTIFIKACSHGKLAIVKYLISLAGCDINAKDRDNITGFFYACRFGHLDIVKYLNSLGYDIYEKNTQFGTGFHYATRNSQIEILKYFVSLGWDINEVDAQDMTPFCYSCHKGNLTIMKYFISLGPRDQIDDDYRISSPFILACVSSNLEAVKYLISLGYNINYKTKFVPYGYDFAKQTNNISLAILLMEYGCEITPILRKNENVDLTKAIAHRIQEIEKSKETMTNLWADIDMFIIETISEFTYGLNNLKRPRFD